MRILISVLSFLLFLAACGGVKQRQISVPEKLIPFNNMVEITAEAYLIETALRVSNDPWQETPFYSVLFYNALFKRNKITAKDFFENLTFYTSDYERTEKLYNAIQDNLNKLQQKGITENTN